MVHLFLLEAGAVAVAGLVVSVHVDGDGGGPDVGEPVHQLLGGHDEQLGHAVRAARNQGQHREGREARRLAERDDVARPALERQQRERHQGHEQELLVDVPACGRGSCSRHAAMACSGMDVASMARAPPIRHRRDTLTVHRAVDAKGRQGKGRGQQPKQKAASAACAAQG